MNTRVNNKYYYYLCKFGESFTSEEYDSEVDCMMDFCKAIKTDEKIWWGQFICHHYEDEWQGEMREVTYTLSGRMEHNL